MSLLQQYARFLVFVNFEALEENSATNLIERENETLITITSAIPDTGLEIDPKIGQQDSIIVFCGSLTKSYQAKLIEKKISGSVNKEPYQLLTYKILSESNENNAEYDKLIRLPNGKLRHGPSLFGLRVDGKIKLMVNSGLTEIK